MSGLYTSRRAVADVLDLGAEASTALATLTATALAALLPPQSHLTLHVVPAHADDLARPRPHSPGDVVVMPSRVPIRPGPGPVLERGAEAVAAVVLHAASMAVGAVAAIASPVQSTARLMTRPLHAAATPDPVPDTVRAAAHAADRAAGRADRRTHLAPTPTPGSSLPRPRRRSARSL